MAEGGACKMFGLQALGHRLGVLCGGANSPAAASARGNRLPKARVTLGRKLREYSVKETLQAFSDMIAVLPATWPLDDLVGGRLAPEEVVSIICRDICDFGSKHGWALLGPASHYIRPAVCRKMWFLVHGICGIGQGEVNWRAMKVQTFADLFPDMRGLVSSVPKYWDMRVFLRMAPEVPPSMHSCWACLAGYATQEKYTGNSKEFCDAVTAFIQTAGEEETQNAARAIFEEARARLEARRSVQPTPLMVLRELWFSGRLAPATARGGAPLPAAIALTAPRGGALSPAATIATTVRRRLRSKSRDPLFVAGGGAFGREQPGPLPHAAVAGGICALAPGAVAEPLGEVSRAASAGIAPLAAPLAGGAPSPALPCRRWRRLNPNAPVALEVPIAPVAKAGASKRSRLNAPAPALAPMKAGRGRRRALPSDEHAAALAPMK